MSEETEPDESLITGLKKREIHPGSIVKINMSFAFHEFTRSFRLFNLFGKKKSIDFFAGNAAIEIL